jgi:dUTP pyrophosphatase
MSIITFATVDRLTVKIINRSPNPLPSYATEGSSGMDLRADVKDEITLQPLERMLVPTGVFIELPTGYEAQVRPRSGLAIKQGITCLNSPGTVDADYRGELKVVLINLSNEPQVIHGGDRIAQMVIQKVEMVRLLQVEDIGTTLRGERGFGHTGKK